MNKKNKIYTAIIILAFGITGYFLYTNFFASKSVSVPLPVSGTETNIGTIPGAAGTAVPVAGIVSLDGSSPAGAVNILPLGDKFDTTILKKLSSQFNVYNYPQVTPEQVGIQPSLLIKTDTDAATKQ